MYGLENERVFLSLSPGDIRRHTQSNKSVNSRYGAALRFSHSFKIFGQVSE